MDRIHSEQWQFDEWTTHVHSFHIIGASELCRNQWVRRPFELHVPSIFCREVPFWDRRIRLPKDTLQTVLLLMWSLQNCKESICFNLSFAFYRADLLCMCLFDQVGLYCSCMCYRLTCLTMFWSLFYGFSQRDLYAHIIPYLYDSFLTMTIGEKVRVFRNKLWRKIYLFIYSINYIYSSKVLHLSTKKMWCNLTLHYQK